DLAMRALELTHPSHRDVLSRSVAAAEALTAAGRLDQALRVAQDTLAKPLPPVAEARLRCALSAILCARGRASDARAEARVVLAQPQLPPDLRDQAMTAQLQAVAGLCDALAGPMAPSVLAGPSQYHRHDVPSGTV